MPRMIAPRENPAGEASGAALRPGETEAGAISEQIDGSDTAEFQDLRNSRRRKIIFCAIIAVICAALIALIWVATYHAISDQRTETLGRAKVWVKAQANLLTESARRELATVDQSLVMLESAWKADPGTFNLRSWQTSLPGLGDLVDEYFIANRDNVIVQDTLPQAVGQGIGGAYANFGRGTLEQITLNPQASPDTKLLVGELNEKGVVRRYLMYLVRPMPGRPGWLVGASYRSSALVKVFGEGALGRTRSGRADRYPPRRRPVGGRAGGGQSEAERLQHGRCTRRSSTRATRASGPAPTGMDDVERVQAFQRVPGRDLVAVVGLDLHDWMAPTETWAEHARELAAMASLLVAAIGGLVLWWLWTLEANRRLRDALEDSSPRCGGGQGRRDRRHAGRVGILTRRPGSAGCRRAAGRLESVLCLRRRRLRRGIAARRGVGRAYGAPAAAGTRGTPTSTGRRPIRVRRSIVRFFNGQRRHAEPADRSPSPLREDRSSHLIERVAERLMRSGALDGSAANLLGGGAAIGQCSLDGRLIRFVSIRAARRGTEGLRPGPYAPRPCTGRTGSRSGPYIDLVALERAGMVDWSRTRSRVSEEFRLIQRQLLTTAFSGPNAQPGFQQPGDGDQRPSR